MFGIETTLALPDELLASRSLSERTRELGGTLELRRHKGLDTEIQLPIPMG